MCLNGVMRIYIYIYMIQLKKRVCEVNEKMVNKSVMCLSEYNIHDIKKECMKLVKNNNSMKQ